MQVYRNLRILTARPTPEDEAAVPHALYGHVDAAVPYSVAAFLTEAAAAIGAARRVGRVPVVVGGTGLYLAALTEGLSEVPPIRDTVRAYWRAQADDPGLHATLARRDPVMAARLRPSDPQRIVRALEVLEATGRSLAEWQRERPPPVLPLAQAEALVIAPDRMALRERIARRFEAMMEAGAVEEAARLAARALPPDVPAMKAIGVAPLAAHAAGALSREDAVAAAVTESRRYAKRQETFFRHRLAGWRRIAAPE